MQTCRRSFTKIAVRRCQWSLELSLASTSLPPHCRLYSSSTVSAADLAFGQPLHETHPHLLSSGELTPGITALEYAQRRSRLASLLPPGAVALLAAAEVQYKSKDVFHTYRQESNFHYLTGFLEPSALTVISRSSSTPPSSSSRTPSNDRGNAEPDIADHTFHLYVQPKDPKEEQWSGYRSGVQAALDVFNADHASDISTCLPELRDLISSASHIYTDIALPSPTSTTSTNTSEPTSLLSRLTNSNKSSSKNTSLPSLLSSRPTSPLTPLLHPLRSIKSPAELTLLRRVGRQSGRALTTSMSRPWDLESSLAAHLTHEFSLHGLEGPAYIPVVAGGPRGSVIHYVSNNLPLNASETVLVDAGGEMGGYVSDITRVWPVSGKFTPEQRELYEVVLSVQRELVGLCREDADVSLDDLHTRAEEGLRERLGQIGFEMGGWKGKRRMNELFPHHVGHFVGMEVHDTPCVSRREKLKAGMVVSVEPGVYVPDGEAGWWPERFRGLAVRVEDTVGIGKEGPIAMSAEAVKEVDDIEALRS